MDARTDLSSLFSPRAIAVVGASGDPSRIGGRPVAYCQRLGFPGAIYPVNPARDTVQGLTAYPDIDSLPAEADLFVLAIPAAQVPAALERAAAKGARVAVVFSSGFGETGEAGEALQQELLEIAARTGVRVLGPNSLGLFCNTSRMAPTFTTFLEDVEPASGNLAIVSQSGAYGAHLAMLASKRGIGLSHFVTTGNESDVTVADCIHQLAGDPAVGVIACYSEGVRDGRRFLEALLAARAAGKPVVIIKVGSSSIGQQAAQSHTASVAGDDAVFDAAVRFGGAERVHNTQAFIDLIYTLSRRPPLAGRRLGVLTMSGGAGVLMADAAAGHGLELTPLPEDARAWLAERIPFGAATNPVDTTAQAVNDMSLVGDALRVMLERGGHDAVVSFFMSWPANPSIGPRLKTAIAEGIEGFDDRTVAIAVNAGAEVKADFDAAGMLVFDDPTFAVDALAASARIGERLREPVPVLESPREPGGQQDLARLDEAQTAALMRDAGVPMSDHRTATTPDEAVAAAEALGYPVAVKILSPDILHKSDAGGIALALPDAEAVRAATRDVLDACRDQAGDAVINGVLVAPMAAPGTDLILGGRVDPVFGPVVVCGLGGIFVEIFNDVAIEIAPVTEERAEALLRRLQAWPVLAGARGGEPADIAASARAIGAFSRFVANNAAHLSSAEINPLRVLPRGQGVVGLDALIVGRDGAT
ncbi:acetate--CoA ligase family protein [Aquisalimonas lutea]|uniref:acetate--CoA ligase family protein n=1 Tax=Aquisalimonas lutea TaxID=1327750 RepID=UPI0025B2AA81|nr:acetate--CoA ligase family protein [Aquisalimonas lutea]MDN3516556.1 acetate--CoA ligase family protein [Aquisalimonas lutea]